MLKIVIIFKQAALEFRLFLLRAFIHSSLTVVINIDSCFLHFTFIHLLYKDESVYVCVCVCMSGGLPPDPHKPSPRNLAWGPHFTQAQHRARGRPKILAPRGTSHTDPV